MGVIALALITTGHLGGDIKQNGLPFWILCSCALAIGLGTYIGGWRVIRTLGKGLVEIESPQGFAAAASSAVIILSSSAAGMALSTTHVATGSILGSGVGKAGAEVRWAVAGRMAVAWLLTLPAAGVVGALTFWISHGIAGFSSLLLGDIVIFAILVTASFYMLRRARQQKIDHTNVNADWDTSTNSVVPADVREAKTTETTAQRTGRLTARRQEKDRLMQYLESILRVLVIGLILGAGLPAVFAGRAGVVLRRGRRGGRRRHGTRAEPGPENPRAAAVRVRHGRDRGRDPVDHESDDHPPLRCRPVPVHPHEMSCE